MVIRVALSAAAVAVSSQIVTAQQPPPPVAISEAPIKLNAHAPNTRLRYQSYRHRWVRCGSREVVPLRVEPVLANVNRSYGGARALGAVLLRFRIDADGRPLSIAPAEAAASRLANDDLIPSFAAWRFSPSDQADKCEVQFAAIDLPVAEAPVEAIRRALALARFRSIAEPELIAKQLHQPGGDCAEDRPSALVQHKPDFRRIHAPPGSIASVSLGFDVDGAGRARRVRVLQSDGNAALDRAGADAMRRWRFVKGEPRRGCSYYWFRNNVDPMVAPPMPEIAKFRPTDADCGDDRDLTTTAALRFPEPMRRRAIEGWAIIAYDVAPWGETGNIRVLATEPASPFGEEAKRIIAQSRAGQGRGATGCVERVLFKLPGS